MARELVGLASLLPDGIAMLGNTGRYVEIGLVFRGRTVEFDPSTLLREQKRIVGASMFPPQMIPRLLDFLVRNLDRYPFHKLISHRYPLADIGEASSAPTGAGISPR